MAPHELGSAWSHDSYNAMQYLRARTPYPPTMTDTAFDYHEQHPGTSNSNDRWQSALEIGCGPGQMSIHLATRFGKVYGQDPSPNMLKLANTVKHMSAEELAEVRLPPVKDPNRIEFLQARGEAPVLPEEEKVDLIMMAACIHWMDWETRESTLANWTKWASLLKPGGTLVVTGGRPVIGPYTGEKGDQIRPLRDWLLDFPLNYPDIDRYYGTSKMVKDLRSGGLYRKLPMPWEHSKELEALWDRHSYCWIPVDDCTVLGEQATSSRLSKVDDPERFAHMISHLPDWIRPSVRRAAKCDDSEGDLVVSMTTPRKMADWVRSTSGYLKFLQDKPEQRMLSLQDQDFAAVELQKVCDKIGIEFDAPIECHHSGAVLCIRRTDKEC
uniref:Methyltransferase type 11 domain-containing protein n=2 Tax=Kalmanozyma brasiliensis (strain GHG001) TaxID=1365824 RepID=V5GJR7_KALBG